MHTVRDHKRAAYRRSKKRPNAHHHGLEPGIAVQSSEQSHGRAENDEEVRMAFRI